MACLTAVLSQKFHKNNAQCWVWPTLCQRATNLNLDMLQVRGEESREALTAPPLEDHCCLWRGTGGRSVSVRAAFTAFRPVVRRCRGVQRQKCRTHTLAVPWRATPDV